MTIRIFESQYGGVCSCGIRFKIGRRVYYNPEGQLTTEDCEQETIFSTKEQQEARNKMCRKCFLVPAANGICGCRDG